MNTTASNDGPLDESDDLINFDDASAVLNSPWGAPIPQLPKSSSNPPASRMFQAKATNLMDAPLSEPESEDRQGRQVTQLTTGYLREAPPAFEAGNAWAKPLVLSPNTPGKSLSRPAAVTPPTDLMQSVSLSQNSFPDKTAATNPFDPDSPGFKASRYYVEPIQRYKCPYYGCG